MTTHPLGWLLFDDYTEVEPIPLGRCTAIEGLFVDLPPRPRERFTLVGCRPEGALAEALGAEPVPLGLVYIISPAGPPSWYGEDLGEIMVIDHRPNADIPGTVDIDLEGFVQVDDRNDAVPRPPDTDEFILLGGLHEPAYGVCQDITGIFRPKTPPAVPHVRLIGCQPQGPLVTAVESIGDATDAGRQRRHIHATAHFIRNDGSDQNAIGVRVHGTVVEAEPSPLGSGLVDVILDNEGGDPTPTAYLDALRFWYDGPPTTKNLWAPFDRAMRRHWAMVAPVVRRAADPPGTTYELDGRYVTDIEGFYCALGEAVNGPGGYFGLNLDGLVDCLAGGFGPKTPFRLVWTHSSVAREHLVETYESKPLLDFLVDLFRRSRVEVELRP